MADPDYDLVRRIAGGDTRAAEALVRLRLPGVVALARRMLGDPAEAEDVAQETFLRVWRDAARWTPTGAPFNAWLCRVATNLCLDRLRKRRERAFDAARDDRPDQAPSAAARLAAAQRAARVRAALQELPERQRAAIELVHFQELSTIDAAVILEVSVDALESLLARGRRGLRAVLGHGGRDMIGEVDQP